MNKKKIAALLVAGIMTIGVVGGTLAWFTSQDSVTNVFNTGKVTDPDGNGAEAGIDVTEIFKDSKGNSINQDSYGNAVYTNPVLPGDVFTKEVKIESKSNYDQFLRAKIIKVWKLGEYEVKSYKEFNSNGTKEIVYYGDNYSVQKNTNGDIVKTDGVTKPADAVTLDYSKINLQFNESNFGNTEKTNTWFGNNEWNTGAGNYTSTDYYYYNQILKENGYTETTDPATDITANILEKVVFKSTDKDNYYKNLTFQVKIQGESIQASNGAAKDSGWSIEVPVASVEGY